MTNSLKRVLSLILAFVMVVGLIPFGALDVYAAETVGSTTTTPNNVQPTASEGYVWVLTDKTEPSSIGVGTACAQGYNYEHTHSEDCFESLDCHNHGQDCYTSYSRCWQAGVSCSHAFHYWDGLKCYGSSILSCDHTHDQSCFPEKGNTTACRLATGGNLWDSTGTYMAHTHKETDSFDTSCYVYTWTLYADANNNGKGDGTSDDPYYTVTYTDGVEDTEIFADQTHNNVLGSELSSLSYNGEINRPGYSYTWSETTSGTTVTRTAVWTLIDYTITWDNGDGTWADGSADEVITWTKNYGDTLTAPAVTAPAGYSFEGWNPTVSAVSGNQTYTAVYSEDKIWTVTYRVDGATYVVDGVEQTFQINATKGQVIPSVDAPDKEYYVFDGWENGGLIGTTPAQDVFLDAKWKVDANDNEVADEKETVTVTVSATHGDAILEKVNEDDAVVITKKNDNTYTIVYDSREGGANTVKVVATADNTNETYSVYYLTGINGSMNDEVSVQVGTVTVTFKLDKFELPEDNEPWQIEVNGFSNETKVETSLKTKVLDEIFGEGNYKAEDYKVELLTEYKVLGYDGGSKYYNVEGETITLGSWEVATLPASWFVDQLVVDGVTENNFKITKLASANESGVDLYIENVMITAKESREEAESVELPVLEYTENTLDDVIAKIKSTVKVNGATGASMTVELTPAEQELTTTVQEWNAKVTVAATKDYLETVANFTIKADISTYTVKFVVDGETVQEDDLPYNTAIVAPADPSKEGHTFAGWGTVAATATADVTYTAQWTVNNYTIEWYVDGKLHDSKEVAYGTALEQIAEPTKTGYTFSGWSEIPATMPAETVRVDGTFSINYYDVKWVWRNAKGEQTTTVKLPYNSDIVVPTDIPTEYVDGNVTYTMTGWTGLVADAKVPAGDVTYTATYTTETAWTVKFDSNGGSQILNETVIVPEGETGYATKPADPTREGYRFDGWYLNGEEYDFTTAVTGDITLTAQWSLYVAQIGDVKYTSLQEAIDAANNGDTIKLIVDLSVDGSDISHVDAPVNGNGQYLNPGIFNVYGKKITIDLNGKNITYTGHANYDITSEASGKHWTGSSCALAHGLFMVNNGGNLTIVGKGNVTVYGMASGVYSCSPNSVATIKGGNWYNYGCETCGGTNLFMYASHGGELYIEDGYFYQALDTNGDSYLLVEHGGSAKNDVVDYSLTKVEVSGGTFVGMNPEQAVYIEQAGWSTQNFGTTDVCAENYQSYQFETGVWTVIPENYIRVTVSDNSAEVTGTTTVSGTTTEYENMYAGSVTIVAAPTVEDGNSKSYVSSITVNGVEQELTYDENYAVTLTVSEDADVVITYTECGFVYDEDGQMRFYVGMENPQYETLYNAVIVSPEYSDAVKSVKYLARPAGTYEFTIPVLFEYTIPYINYPIKIGGSTESTDLDEAWLDVGETFKTLTPDQLQAQYDTEIEAIKAKIAAIDLSGLTWTNASDYIAQFTAIQEELNVLINTIKTEAQYLGYHQFGESGITDEDGNTLETLQVIYDNGAMHLEDGNVTVTLVDDRIETTVTGGNLTFEYDEYTDEDIMNALALTTADGTVIEGELTKYVTLTGKNVGEYTYTVYYEGSWDYKPCSVEFTLTVVKAPSNTDVPNVNVTYGESYDATPVSTNKHGKVINIDTIEFIVGLDVAELDIDGDGVKGLTGKVQLLLPSELQTILSAIGMENGATVSLNELISMMNNDLVAPMLEQWGITSDMVDTLESVLDQINNVVEANDMQITIGGTYPTNIGAYLHGAVTVDGNYETSYDVGYIIIKPATAQVYLDWNYTDANGFLSWELLKETDLGATAYDDAAFTTENADATALIQNLFLGVDDNGELILELFPEGTDVDTIENALGNGAFTQLAFIADFGNELVYAKPIVRAFVIVPNALDVQLVNADGEALDTFTTTFDNTGKKLYVTVDGNQVECEVTYAGISTNTNVYEPTTEAPTKAGAYVATATYIQKDANGEVTGIGVDVAILVIEPAESSIEVTGGTVTYDGEGHTATVTVNAPNPNADYTLISGGAYVSGDIDKIGVDALHGNVNIDFPRWLDEALAEHEFKTEGVDTAYLIDFISSYRDDLVAAIPVDTLVELGLTETEINAYIEKLNAYIDELLAVLAKLPNDVTLTFNDDVTYTEPGYYFYYGIVTDSDVYPSTDTGLLVIEKMDMLFGAWHTVVPYDGKEHTVYVPNDYTSVEGAPTVDYMTMVVDREANTVNFILDADAQYILKTVERILDIELPEDMNIADLRATLVEYGVDVDDFAGALVELIDTVLADMEKPTDPQEYAHSTYRNLVQIQEILANLPENGTITINDSLPVDVGAYEFYLLSYSQYYKTEAASAVLFIEPIHIVIDDVDNSKVYGDADPELTATVKYYSYSGLELINSGEKGNYENDYSFKDPTDNIYVEKVEITELPENVLTYTVTREAGENVGLYDMTVEYELTDSKNYVVEIVEDGKDFEIIPAELTITLNDASKTYGESDPTWTWTVDGLKNGDTEDVLNIVASRTNDDENVGTYENVITATTAENVNYNITIVKGDFTINEKTVWDAELVGELTYNGTEQTQNVVVTDGDKILVEGVDYTVTGNTGTDAGEYTLTITGINNYAGEKTLTWNIAKAKVTVTVNSDEVIYGDEIPAVVLTYSDELAESELNISMVWNAVKGSNVGTYGANFTWIRYQNWDVDYVPGNLTIVPKEITEDDVALDGTLTYNGTEQTQNITVTEGVTYEVTGNTGTNAGDYTLTVTGTGNYTGTVNVDWTIAKKAATITADDKSMVAGNAVPELTATVEGVIEGESLNYTLSTKDPVAIGEHGTYDIVVTLGENPNYDVTVTNGTLTVEECVVTVNGVAYSSWVSAMEANDTTAGKNDYNLKNAEIKLYADIVDDGDIQHRFNGNMELDLNGHDFYTKKTLTVSGTTKITGEGTFDTGTDGWPLVVGGDVVLDPTVHFTGMLQFNNGSKGNLVIGDEYALGYDGKYSTADYDNTYVRIVFKGGLQVLDFQHGHVTLTEDDTTLVGQQITVGKDAHFTVAEGVTLTLDPTTEITIKGTVDGDGIIKVGTLDHLDMVLNETKITKIEIAEGIVIDEYTLDRADVTYYGAANLLDTDVVITAGTFDADVTDNCATGYCAKDEDDDGMWIVKPYIAVTVDNAEMRVGDALPEVVVTVNKFDHEVDFEATYAHTTDGKTLGEFVINADYTTPEGYYVNVVPGTLTVGLGDYICWNTETGEYFNDITNAFDDADTKSGHTIQMLKDATDAINNKDEVVIIVNAGTTFDLNGYYVEAGNLLSFGVVLDTATGTDSKIDDGDIKTGGILISNDTTKAWTQLQPENGGYLPIYDTVTGSYKFYEGTSEGVIDAYDTKGSNATMAKFRFRLLFENLEAYQIIARTENSGFEVVLNMNWTGMTGFDITYKMDVATVVRHASQQITTSRGTVMSLTIYGIEKISGGYIDCQPTVVSKTGVTFVAETLTYNVP